MVDVSKPIGLMRLKDRFYYRVRVPTDLIPALGRYHKVALGTGDHAQAKRLCIQAAAKFEMECQNARAAQRGELPRVEIADIEGLARKFVDGQVSGFRAELVKGISPSERMGRLDDCSMFCGVLRDSDSEAAIEEVARAWDAVLSGVDVTKLSDEAAAYASDVVRRALIESERRFAAILRDDHRRAHFDHLFANRAGNERIANLPQSTLSLKELTGGYLREYRRKQVAAKRDEKVQSAVDLILEFFGPETPTSDLNLARCREFRDVLSKLPTNRRKLMPKGSSLSETLAIARQKGLKTLSPGTQETYLGVLRQVLDEAHKHGCVPVNFAKELAPLGEKTRASEKRNPFSAEQLRAIFDAPIYRGCVDDERNYANPGPNVIRRARFWIPLIALFTGMRLNEICQLDVSDIRRTKDGIDYIAVNDDASDKRIKTAGSKREIPIHPELVRIGFLKFVADRRKAGDRKLFSELKQSKKGYYSERFQRWFNEGFLPSCGARLAKTSFHSFRHSFADAMIAAELPRDVREAIGGWSPGRRTMDNYGNGVNARVLRPWIDKIPFSQIDFAHIERE